MLAFGSLEDHIIHDTIFVPVAPSLPMNISYKLGICNRLWIESSFVLEISGRLWLMRQGKTSLVRGQVVQMVSILSSC